MLVSAGTAAVLESYIVTLVECMISEDSGVVTVLKVVVIAMAAIIAVLMREVLVALAVGR